MLKPETAATLKLLLLCSPWDFKVLGELEIGGQMYPSEGASVSSGWSWVLFWIKSVYTCQVLSSLRSRTNHTMIMLKDD